MGGRADGRTEHFHTISIREWPVLQVLAVRVGALLAPGLPRRSHVALLHHLVVAQHPGVGPLHTHGEGPAQAVEDDLATGRAAGALSAAARVRSWARVRPRTAHRSQRQTMRKTMWRRCGCAALSDGGAIWSARTPCGEDGGEGR